MMEEEKKGYWQQRAFQELKILTNCIEITEGTINEMLALRRNATDEVQNLEKVFKETLDEIEKNSAIDKTMELEDEIETYKRVEQNFSNVKTLLVKLRSYTRECYIYGMYYTVVKIIPEKKISKLVKDIKQTEKLSSIINKTVEKLYRNKNARAIINSTTTKEENKIKNIQKKVESKIEDPNNQRRAEIRARFEGRPEINENPIEVEQSNQSKMVDKNN